MKIKNFIPWICFALLAWVAISTTTDMQRHINKLETELMVCRDWNNIFIKAMTKEQQ